MTDWLRQLKFRILGTFRKRRNEEEMAEELRLHRELQREHNLREGMTSDESMDHAWRQFGGRSAIEEACREERRLLGMELLLQDFRFSARTLIKSRGFTTVALLTLALGIGVNTTAFTALNQLLWQSLPFRDTASLVQIWVTKPGNPMQQPGAGDFLDIQELSSSFSSVAAYAPGDGASFVEPGQPAVQVDDCPISADFFPMMGVPVQFGRMFTRDEERRLEPLVLVSDAFWRMHFGADPKILGRTVRLNSKSYTVVGVMPPAIDRRKPFNGNTAFWPLEPFEVNRELRGGGWYHVAARLKAGISREQAQAELTVLAAELATKYPKTNAEHGFKVIPYPTSAVNGSTSQLMWMVTSLSFMVLLIGCVNLANLQLVRVTRRSREIGIRLALGSSRAQLARLLVTESLLLSVAGGALGIVASQWTKAYISRYFEIDMPLDFRVMSFAFVASLIAGSFVGTFPAWLAARTDLNTTLRTGGRSASAGRSRHRMRQVLVITELVLAFTLLAGAGFFINGLYQATHQNLGWKPDHKLVGVFELDHDHYGEERDPRSLAFSYRMLAGLKALPGVEAAELSQDSTPAWFLQPATFRVDGQPMSEPGQELVAGSANVTPEFFDVYGVTLLRGRNFQESDRPGTSPVVIVNSALAEKFWPGENPLGKRIGRADAAHPDWATVVGVMNNFKGAWDIFDHSTSPWKMLRPWSQNNHRFITFNLRTAGDPAGYKGAVAKLMSGLAPDLALSNMWSVDELMAVETNYYTFIRRILMEISALGLFLASIGIYGVVANLASERTKEIGIRMALGAQPRRVAWLFLREGIYLAVGGVLLGAMSSFALFKILSHIVPDFPAGAPWFVATIGFALISVTIVASWMPACQTTKVNPTIALRAE